jgi:hypothetical protein
VSVDRYGNKIQLGWAAHELLWVEAAMTLFVEERPDAFRDIAAMSGRSYSAVRTKAYGLALQRRRDAAIDAAIAKRRRKAGVYLDPSMIAWPTASEKMVRRASRTAELGAR